MNSEEKSDRSANTTAPPLSEILDTHAKVESQVGEIYINFATAFGHNTDDDSLRREVKFLSAERFPR